MNQYAVAFFCPASQHTSGSLDNWVNKAKPSQPGGHMIYKYVDKIKQAWPSITKQVWVTFPAPAPLNGEFVVVYFESSDTDLSIQAFLNAANTSGIEAWCMNQIPGGWGARIPANVFYIV